MQVSVSLVLFSDGNDDNRNDLCSAAPSFRRLVGAQSGFSVIQYCATRDADPLCIHCLNICLEGRCTVVSGHIHLHFCACRQAQTHNTHTTTAAAQAEVV